MRYILFQNKFINSAVNIIIVINVLIFLIWPLIYHFNQEFMPKNFLVSWSSLIHGRWWTLMTSIFSHFNFFHLLLNLYVLKEFGGNLEHQIGSFQLLILYLFTGLLGSLSHCLFSRYLLLRPDLSALGASGSLSGILIYLTLRDPKKKVFLFGLVPIPLLYAVAMIVMIDLRGLWGQYHGEMNFIGHGAHLGGCVGGLLYGLMTKRALSTLDG